MEWSRYQRDIFDAIAYSQDNVIVNACPGSGKTTTLNQLCKLLPSKSKTMYLAFNRAIVDEAKTKLPEHVSILTLNGLGHRAIMQAYGKIKVDARKVFKIIKDTFKWGREDAAREVMLAKAVAMAKMIPGFDHGKYEEMVDTYALDEYEGMYHHIITVLDINDDMTNIIDFNDQIRFVYVHNLDLPEQDYTLVDEAQDLNVMQALMIEKLQSRYCLVGDKHQAIYGFRGAMSNSMSYLQERFDCLSLPLSLTYRCSKAIVQQARALFADIEALPEASDGMVEWLTKEQKGGDRLYHNGDIILCRNTAPLVQYGYALLRRKVACHIRGRDIGEGLIRFIKGFQARDISSLSGLLDDWYHISHQAALSKGYDQKAQAIEDKYDACMLFCDMALQRGNGISLVCQEIEDMFSQGKGVMLSTIHKAKGLEAEQVYLLDRHLLPSKYAKHQWQLEQESNLEYVAVTRAKEYLGYM